jgi:hypothetical protein
MNRNLTAHPNNHRRGVHFGGIKSTLWEINEIS